MNNISFVSIALLLLYEHRHLFTDDSQYNSLVLSHSLNEKIELLDIKKYESFNDDMKKELYTKIYFADNNGLNHWYYSFNMQKFCKHILDWDIQYRIQMWITILVI